MLLMHNDSLASIGQFNVGRRAFKTARKIKELVDINLFQPIALTLPRRDIIKKCAHVLIA